MPEVTAQQATCQGQGAIIQPEDKNRAFAQGGVVSGTGTVTQTDGTVEEFEFKSDPLTQEQADHLNATHGRKP